MRRFEPNSMAINPISGAQFSKFKQIRRIPLKQQQSKIQSNTGPFRRNMNQAPGLDTFRSFKLPSETPPTPGFDFNTYVETEAKSNNQKKHNVTKNPLRESMTS